MPATHIVFSAKVLGNFSWKFVFELGPIKLPSIGPMKRAYFSQCWSWSGPLKYLSFPFISISISIMFISFNHVHIHIIQSLSHSYPYLSIKLHNDCFFKGNIYRDTPHGMFYPSKYRGLCPMAWSPGPHWAVTYRYVRKVPPVTCQGWRFFDVWLYNMIINIVSLTVIWR